MYGIYSDTQSCMLINRSDQYFEWDPKHDRVIASFDNI